MILDDDSPLPVSIPAVIFQKPNQELQRHGGIRASNSGDTEESIPERMDTVEVDHHIIKPVSVDSIAAGRVPVSDNLQEHMTASRDDHSNAHDSTDQKVDVPHIPPVFVVPVGATAWPPKEPIKSKTLQTRRKRKKKKKKPVLKRVSSKQSINEMETINEMDEGMVDLMEEGSEFDGSEYSEYSTDDEDDGLLVVNTADRNGEDTTSPKVSPGPVMPPSPIREEPKIRRLPPPWI